MPPKKKEEEKKKDDSEPEFMKMRNRLRTLH